MAREDCPIKIGSTWAAAADLSSYQWRVMRQSAALTCTYASTAGSGGIGILYNKPDAAGKGCAVVIGGVCPVEAGAAFAQGAKLTNDTVGRLVTAAANDKVVAIAVEAASGAGAIVGAHVNPPSLAFSDGQGYRVPGNIETAAFTAAVNATWEDENIVTLLNAQTTTDISTSRAIHVFGVLEIISGNAVAHTVQWGDGDSMSGGDKVQQYTTPPVAGSYFTDVDLYTDASGNIKILVDDVTQVTFKLHPRGYSYVQNTAIS